MPTPKFQITTEGAFIHVLLCGHWNLTTEGKYLNALAESFARMQGRPWGMLVDMREWKLSKNMFQSSTANVHLDRKGQVCECWVVSHQEQASELQPFVEAVPNIRFKRVMSEKQAQEWLALFKL